MKFDIETSVVIVAFLTSFFAVFLAAGIVIGVPSIASEFSMNNIVQNWIITIALLVVAVFTLPAGQISGKFGVKKALIAGVLIFVFASIGACLSFSAESFLFFRVIQGIGGAFSNVAAMAMVVQAIKPQNRGKALGFTVTGVYLAGSLSPVICGFLVYNFGWRSMFYFTLPFFAICLALMVWKIPGDWKTYENDKIDSLGYLVYGIGILLFIYGFTNLMNTVGQVCTFIGFILLIVFGYYETRVQTPAFNMRLFKNMKFTSSNVAALCSYLAVAALTTILNYHFQYVRGWNAQMAGLILIVTPIIMAFMAPNSGKLSDRIHPQKLAAIGMSIAIPGCEYSAVSYCSGNGSAGYRYGALHNSKYQCNNEFSAAKGDPKCICGAISHEDNRPDHESGSAHFSIRMDYGQFEIVFPVCRYDCSKFPDSMYNLYNHLYNCDIRFSSGNKVQG